MPQHGEWDPTVVKGFTRMDLLVHPETDIVKATRAAMDMLVEFGCPVIAFRYDDERRGKVTALVGPDTDPLELARAHDLAAISGEAYTVTPEPRVDIYMLTSRLRANGDLTRVPLMNAATRTVQRLGRANQRLADLTKQLGIDAGSPDPRIRNKAAYDNSLRHSIMRNGKPVVQYLERELDEGASLSEAIQRLMQLLNFSKGELRAIETTINKWWALTADAPIRLAVN